MDYRFLIYFTFSLLFSELVRWESIAHAQLVVVQFVMGGQQHGEYDGRYILKLEPYYHEGCYGGQHCEVGGGLVYKLQHWYN